MQCGCGDEIVEPSTEMAIVASGGWCAPAEDVYDMPRLPPMCADCKARMLVMMEIGIDPGRHGENLKVRRGGIKYHYPKGD